MQPEFARDLLRAAKESGINTALESTAYAKYEVIESILPYLDTYLLDVKHMDSRKHKEFTGRPNELIQENVRKITDSGMTEVIIRVPVIPGFNDRKDEIEAIARFASTLKNVKKMHLLPYHRLGQDKYAGLGREYFLDGILPPTNEYMEMLLDAAVRVSGLDCQIGG